MSHAQWNENGFNFSVFKHFGVKQATLNLGRNQAENHWVFFFIFEIFLVFPSSGFSLKFVHQYLAQIWLLFLNDLESWLKEKRTQVFRCPVFLFYYHSITNSEESYDSYLLWGRKWRAQAVFMGCPGREFIFYPKVSCCQLSSLFVMLWFHSMGWLGSSGWDTSYLLTISSQINLINFRHLLTFMP